tara:strand:- start:360 stop:590 length:231 start_codon:yes stop_codon:yes gene_type:complete
MEENEKPLKETLSELIYSPKLQFIAFLTRIVFVVILGYLAYLGFTEIEAIKLLSYDACEYCMSKTGAICSTIPKFP